MPVWYDQLEAARPHWYPFVEAIARRQRCRVEQRLADVYSGNVMLILIWDHENNYPRALCGYSNLLRGDERVAKLVWATGHNRDTWKTLYGPLEDWFRKRGYAGMAALTRPGWNRDMRNWGYKLKHMEYEKDF